MRELLGFNPERGAFLGRPRVEKMNLRRDLWLFQYFDGSKPAGQGQGKRSYTYWTPFDPGHIGTLATAQKVRSAVERNALIDLYGSRTHVQVARIPAGTPFSAIFAGTAPKAQESLINPNAGKAGSKGPGLLQAPYLRGRLRPELEPNRILETIGEVRLGGDPQVAFAKFDPRWLEGVRQLPANAQYVVKP